ncbi:MAG TPA: 50S ribosomal protein L11 methyltransferase [Clostridiales bacterium]|nr:50S ribosomal protein L11 methyltransferase [Clostridiales bacterium]
MEKDSSGCWTRIRVSTKVEQLDRLSAIMCMTSDNLMIEDPRDMDPSIYCGELVDERILKADKTRAAVSVFIPPDGDPSGELELIGERLAEAGVEGEIELCEVREDDWANSWKDYYKPRKIGKIVVVPQWEEYTPGVGEIILKMDPGMAFGTGTHETTILVIKLLQKFTRPGCRVLDVGCGSGILAICAALLGAGVCRAYDIDPLAVRVAKENIGHNGVGDRVSCNISDLLTDVSLEGGGYDIICANIVADVIIRMAADAAGFMNKGGVLLASGIISERAGEVAAELVRHGLCELERIHDNGWCALVFGEGKGA